MSRDRFVKLIGISFHWLLIALLCVAALQYRGSRFAELGGGFIYFCLAGYFSILATASRWQKLFVDAGYMSFLVALLNYFASPKGAQLLVAYQVVLAVVVCIVYAHLLLGLVVLPIAVEDRRYISVCPDTSLVARIGVSVGVAVGVAAFVCFSIGGALYLARSKGLQGWPAIRPLEIAMLFLALSSAILGISLLVSLRVADAGIARKLKGLGFAVGIILLAGLVEYIFRLNWLLFLLSSITFAGAFLAFGRVWTLVRAAG